MGGAELRDALLSQVQADLGRCHTALMTLSKGTDMSALTKTAHEIKGVAATVGAVALAEVAMRVEQLSAGPDTASLAPLVTDFAAQTQDTIAALADLARGD